MSCVEGSIYDANYHPVIDLSLSNWVSNGFKFPILLSQYWYCFPALKWTLISLGIFQCVVCVLGLVLIAIYATRAQNSGHGFWDGNSPEDEFTRVGTITMPILVYIWEFFLGLLLISIPIVGLCSTTMTWILAHVWMEFPIFVFRFFFIPWEW